MPVPGFERRIPDEVREWLEAEFVRRHWTGYAELLDELNRRLEEVGERPVSMGPLHRFGKSVEERISELQRSREIAKTIAESVPDDEGQTTETTIRLALERLQGLLVMGDLDPEGPEFKRVTTAIGDLTRALVSLKRYALFARDKAKERLAEMERSARSGARKNLDPETLRIVREEVFGVTG